MASVLLEKLNKIGKKIYNDNELLFAGKLFYEINRLNLDDISMTTGYFLNADLKNNDVRALITDNFGDRITKNVELLKRISNVNFPESSKQITDLRKLFIKLTDDISIIFIKLAERLTALKFYENDREKINQLSEECLYLYSPIAHRLGIRRIYTEMEDISFKYLFPEDYRKLKKTVEKRRPDLEKKLITMGATLKKTLEKYNISFRLQHRVKRLYSIYRKLKNKENTLDEIYDLMAMRVITDSESNCYLTLGVVHNNWIPIAGRFRDWITYPKQNGYRSIQTTVLSRKGEKYEIQIRTEEMHQQAEYGQAAHWAYKEGISARDAGINQLREFLENDEYFENPHELLEKLKSEMKSDVIHVLTPKGDIKTLPVGSTPVDYAFSIHTDLGYKVTGARVNGRVVKLKTELKSGDVVDVITQNNAVPSRDWLSFVKTSRSRSKILRWFKNNERMQLISDGKRSFEELKRRYKKYMRGQSEDAAFRDNLQKMGYQSSEDLYFALATKGLKPSKNLLSRLFPDAFVKDHAKKDSAGDRSRSSKLEPRIKVEGLANIDTKFAKCCNPIKGEPIVAYVTRKAGIKIHRKDCPYIKSGSFYSENFKKAEWISKDSVQSVHIKIIGDNYAKILKTLVDESSEHSINIISTEYIKHRSKHSGLYAEVEVKDIAQLDKLLSKIRSQRFIEMAKVL